MNMLSRWLSSRTRAQSAAIPEGERIYAIGDIHGRLDNLDTLLAMIAADEGERGPAATRLVFLGDLIDRGPESAGVVERVMAIRAAAPDTRILKGNHEEIFLQALDGDLAALRLFCRIGGRETFLSYGVDPAVYDALDYPGLLALAQASIPDVHRRFLDGLEDMVIAGDYAFVHAGIRPGVPLDAQQPSDLRWIRREFLRHRGTHDKVVVHGHSITEDVEDMGNRIGIDTGAFASGRLTALGLESTERWILQTAPAVAC